MRTATDSKYNRLQGERSGSRGRKRREQVSEEHPKDLLSADAIVSVKGIRTCGYLAYDYLFASCQDPLCCLEGVKAFREKVEQLLPRYKVTYQKCGALREGKMPTLHPAQLLIIMLSTRKQSRDMLAKYKNTVFHAYR